MRHESVQLAERIDWDWSLQMPAHRAVSHRGERAFDRIRTPQMFPMLGAKLFNRPPARPVVEFVKEQRSSDREKENRNKNISLPQAE
jgi:hypothetical protein